MPPWGHPGPPPNGHQPMSPPGNVAFIPAIAQAMGRFAPSSYRGVNATQGFMGLR